MRSFNKEKPPMANPGEVSSFLSQPSRPFPAPTRTPPVPPVSGLVSGFGTTAIFPPSGSPVNREGVVQRCKGKKGKSTKKKKVSYKDYSADDEDSDDDYVPPVPKSKSKKQDPKSTIKKGTIKSKKGKYEYETEGGLKYKESDSGDELTTTVSGLTFDKNYDFRNNVLLAPPFKIKERRTKGKGKKLSMGQKSSRQRVGSHRTPSWLGMRAGKQYRNVDYTSPFHNSRVEKWEKEAREKMEHGKEYTYKHKVRKKKLKNLDNNDIEEITKEANYEKWQSKKRVKKRVKKIREVNPEVEMIMEERREIHGNKKKHQKTFGPDWRFVLPPRAYDPRKRKIYKEYRGESSESSDEEIEKPPKKK